MSSATCAKKGEKNHGQFGVSEEERLRGGGGSRTLLSAVLAGKGKEGGAGGKGARFLCEVLLQREWPGGSFCQ